MNKKQDPFRNLIHYFKKMLKQVNKCIYINSIANIFPNKNLSSVPKLKSRKLWFEMKWKKK